MITVKIRKPYKQKDFGIITMAPVIFNPDANKSIGSFDDFYDTNKYKSAEEAYKQSDFVRCDYENKAGINYIILKHERTGETKEHKLIYQNPVCGLDVSDDQAISRLADELLKMEKEG